MEPLVNCQGEKRDLSSYRYLENPKPLNKGTYYAKIKVEWRTKTNNSVGFEAYGPSEPKMTRIENPSIIESLRNRLKGMNLENFEKVSTV